MWASIKNSSQYFQGRLKLCFSDIQTFRRPLSNRQPRQPAIIPSLFFPTFSSEKQNDHARTLPTRRHRACGAEKMGRRAYFQRLRRRFQTQILLPLHVPLPQRQAAHGACAQLHHRRRIEPLQTLKRLQRHAAYGLGRVRHAGGKRGDEKQRRPRRLDLRQHRIHENPAQKPGFCD